MRIRYMSSIAALFLVVTSGCSMDAQGDGAAEEESLGSNTESLVVGKTNFLRNLATQFCLDSNAAGSVYTTGCYFATFQGWVVTSTQFGVQLKNLQTGRCLDSNTSGNVYTLPCNGGSFQQWTFQFLSGGQRLRNVATGRVLDSNTAGSVYTLPANNGSFQKWEVFFNP